MDTQHDNLKLPAFFPDATVGVVRSVDSKDLENAGVPGVVTSTFHLYVNQASGSLHKLMGWNRPILTDSGGFQVFSLLRSNPKSGRITENGFEFDWNGKKIDFTPEESIRFQMELGSDILICLDQCTDPEMGLEFQKEAVERTIEWAKRCKEEFEKQLLNISRQSSDRVRPVLFAVIQGGDFKELRKRCAEELIKIGFDGYCYGGWPIDKEKRLLEDILEFSAKLMPDEKPKYALGVGKPEDIVKCFKMGYSIFDCVIPTREARHKRLYIFNEEAESKQSSMLHIKGLSGNFYHTETINLKFANDSAPISKNCDCYSCLNFSRAYLFHLFKIGDSLSLRLATIHNLRFYMMLMERLNGIKGNPVKA